MANFYCSRFALLYSASVHEKDREDSDFWRCQSEAPETVASLSKGSIRFAR